MILKLSRAWFPAGSAWGKPVLPISYYRVRVILIMYSVFPLDMTLSKWLVLLRAGSSGLSHRTMSLPPTYEKHPSRGTDTMMGWRVGLPSIESHRSLAEDEYFDREGVPPTHISYPLRLSGHRCLPVHRLFFPFRRQFVGGQSLSIVSISRVNRPACVSLLSPELPSRRPPSLWPRRCPRTS